MAPANWELITIEQFAKELPLRTRRLLSKPKPEAKKLAVEYSLLLKRLLDKMIDDHEASDDP